MTPEQHVVFDAIAVDVIAEIQRALGLAKEGKFERAVIDPETTNLESAAIFTEEVGEMAVEAHHAVATAFGLSVSASCLSHLVNEIEAVLSRFRKNPESCHENEEILEIWTHSLDDELVQVISVATQWLIRLRIAQQVNDGVHP